jgi:hypothetical protein
VRPAAASGVAGLLVAAGTFGCGGGDDDDVAMSPRPECETGAVRTQGPIKRATVLGCGRMTAGQRLELWASRDDAGPCIVIVGLPGGPRACGRAPSERVPQAEKAIGGPAIVRRAPRAPIELYGETSPEIKHVIVHFRLGKDPPRQRRATLIRVEHRSALRRARIREPFGYFIGSVPSSAHDVVAKAFDSTGTERGQLEFDRVINSMAPRAFLLR